MPRSIFGFGCANSALHFCTLLTGNAQYLVQKYAILDRPPWFSCFPEYSSVKITKPTLQAHLESLIFLIYSGEKDAKLTSCWHQLHSWSSLWTLRMTADNHPSQNVPTPPVMFIRPSFPLYPLQRVAELAFGKSSEASEPRLSLKWKCTLYQTARTVYTGPRFLLLFLLFRADRINNAGAVIDGNSQVFCTELRLAIVFFCSYQLPLKSVLLFHHALPPWWLRACWSSDTVLTALTWSRPAHGLSFLASK